jgi:hypothetical protein
MGDFAVQAAIRKMVGKFGANVIKLFTNFRNKLECLSLASPFQHCLLFVDKARSLL